MIRNGRLRELVLFLLVGGTSAAIYALLGVFLTAGLQLRPSLAVLVAVAIVLPPTYLAQRSLTFRSQRPHRSAFLRYVLTQAISNAAAILLAEVFTDRVVAQPWLAFLAIAILVASMNFVLLKVWTFSCDRHGS
jgi:putative flippase GtrA